MSQLSSRHWKRLLVEGLVSLSFGVLVLAFPPVAALTIAVLVAAWAAAAGFAQIMVGSVVAGAGGRSWPFALSGVVSLGAAAIAIAFPVPTILSLVTLIALWQIAVGALELVAAWQARGRVDGLVGIVLGGVARIVVGSIVVAMPLIGIRLGLLAMSGTAIVVGVLLVTASLRLRTFSSKARALAESRATA